MPRLDLLLLALVSLLGVVAAPTRADTISAYTFVGACPDCDPSYGSQGTAFLELKNYTPGDPLAANNFVTFVFSSGLYNFTIDNIGLSISGSLRAFSSPANVEISDEFDQFMSSADGAWCAGSVHFPCGTGPAFDPSGSGPSSVWSAPEPSTWAMLLIGFIALAFAARRRRDARLNRADGGQFSRAGTGYREIRPRVSGPV